MKRCMADLTRLLMALRHDTAGLFRLSTSAHHATAPRATSSRPARQALGMAVLLGLGLLVATPNGVWARQNRHLDEPRDGVGQASTAVGQDIAVVALTALPRQAQDVYQRILAGGPFRYEKDGVVFGNRERLLPRQPRGFYREYTVPTPGERDRGARRIVCGGKEVRQPETCFYTGDHYASFRTIDPRH